MAFIFEKIILLLAINYHSLLAQNTSPVAVLTWNFHKAAQKAWYTLFNEKRSALDAIEESCNFCENNGGECRWEVGLGGCPNENGDTTLDALLMDGVTMNVGAVGAVKDVKNPISIARKVMENTDHTLLVGESVTQFAKQMGFETQSLNTEDSKEKWQKWKENSCQPNYWMNVVPDPANSCGPYTPIKGTDKQEQKVYSPIDNEIHHDTMGVLTLDVNGNVAAGVSTNGLDYKIPGRLGDSPVAGAGTYADATVGAAACTGVGDISLRFLPSYTAVEAMRNGATPAEAAKIAVNRMAKFYPKHSQAVITMNNKGEYGVYCHGFLTFNYSFPYHVANEKLGDATLMYHPCFNTAHLFTNDSRKLIYNYI
uniref:Aspartylglucosaminidase n=1 Tax=Leptopilina heterotoma TaxID=63436 RepID=A0A141NXG8_9HYME|nr:aspartylglucosaminidase [Leptopilina heterotoma]